MMGFQALKTTRAINEIRSIPNDSNHSYVLTPVEKECVERLTNYLIKSPLVQLRLKQKICEQLS